MKPRLPLLTIAAAVLLLGAASVVAVRPEDVLHEVAAVPAEVSRSVDVGRLDGDVRFTRAILVLPARDAAGLERFLESQQDPFSPDFRRWLTPEDFGRRFGAPEADVAALRAYLEANGLEVEDVPAGRTALLFSGRAADVERAFATEIREVFVDGAVRVANVRPARLPAGLARRTAGLLSLNSFPRRKALARRTPAYTDGSGRHVLAPADFATIYGIDALAAAGINGTGRKIAVLAQTNVTVADTRFFRQYFGLPANDPQVVLNGPDAGINGDEIEADLDIQWAGAVAPAAQVLLVVSKTTLPSYGVDLSALYAVNNNVADVLNLSYGACENDFADSDTTFYTNIWAQAAAQGMTSFVSSGDSGAAGCEGQSATTGTVRSVNGLGSSPYATCVGGTQYLDTSTPSAYWSSTNDPVTKKSAKGAIPEGAWNESGVGSGLAATGGGVSVLFTRPPWQNVAGIPAGTGRAVPDISVAGAGHTPYYIVMGGSGSASGLARVYGTSASSPAFAGIAALLSQRAGSRLGNLNPLLYALGQTQYGTSGTATAGTGPFHDVTTGSNSVPGVTGYDAGPGYDAATGLGSPDVTALAAAIASPVPAGLDLSLSASPAVAAVAAGSSLTVTVALAQPAVAADAVATLTLAGLPSGLTASFSPSKMDVATTGIVSRGQGALLTLAAAPSTAAGTYTLTLAASSGAVVRRVSLFVTVGPQPAAPPSGPGVQAPVVLDVFGAGGSHYTSDLVAVNRGASDATLLLRFAQTPAPATPGPTIARSLGAGRQFTVADVIAFLNANGYSLPTDGSAKLGTLFATFVGVTDPLTVFVGSRTSTPNPNASVGGAFGTFSAASATGAASNADAWIYGLRENASYRSNLALVHAPGAASGATSGPVALEVQIYDGDSGAPAGAPLTQVLQPGEFFQYNRVLTPDADRGRERLRARPADVGDRPLHRVRRRERRRRGGRRHVGRELPPGERDGGTDPDRARPAGRDALHERPDAHESDVGAGHGDADVHGLARPSRARAPARRRPRSPRASSSSSRTRSRTSAGSASRSRRRATRAARSSSRARRRSRAPRTRTRMRPSAGRSGSRIPRSARPRGRRARPGSTASGRTPTRARTSRSRTREPGTPPAWSTPWTSSTRIRARPRPSSRRASPSRAGSGRSSTRSSSRPESRTVTRASGPPPERRISSRTAS